MPRPPGPSNQAEDQDQDTFYRLFELAAEEEDGHVGEEVLSKDLR